MNKTSRAKGPVTDQFQRPENLTIHCFQTAFVSLWDYNILRSPQCRSVGLLRDQATSKYLPNNRGIENNVRT